MVMLLELFSGTCSVSNALKTIHPELQVISLDFNENMEKYTDDTFICADIMEWDYTSIPVPDYIWASPNCKWYSNARKGTTEDELKIADKMFIKTFDIINYFLEKNPKMVWFLENPWTGKLKTRPFMSEHTNYVVADYCRYGFNYMKPTVFYTNKLGITVKPRCKMDCDKVVVFDDNTRSHRNTFGDGKIRKKLKAMFPDHRDPPYIDRIRIPSELILDLFRV
jgi:hypothetical protein